MIDKAKLIDLGIKVLILVMTTVLGWFGVAALNRNTEQIKLSTETIKATFTNPK